MMELSPQLLEAINGTLFITFFVLVCMFLRYIALEFMRPDVTWQEARAHRAAAIAMLFLLLGECLIRGHVWVWRHFNLPVDNPVVTWGVNAGVVVCIIGAICALRHFSPQSFGRWFWIGVPLAGLAVAVTLALWR